MYGLGMGMPRKGARKVVVDGRAYRWRLNPPPYDSEEWMVSPPRHRASSMFLQADCPRPGRVCQVHVGWRDDVPVTPEVVRTILRRCIEAGWDPDERGSAFQGPAVDVTEIETRDSVVREVMGS